MQYGVQRILTLLSCVLHNETDIGDVWAKSIIDHASSAVKTVLDHVNQADNRLVNEKLLGICVSHIQECLDWMESKKNGIDNVVLVDFLTSHLDPFSREVRECPFDYWRCLLNSNCVSSSFLSFVFVLAFQQNGANMVALFRKSFDEVYRLLSKSRFQEKNWERIAVYADCITWVKSWDKCKRLCMVVILQLYKNGYGKDIVKDVSNNRSIRERLLKYWKKIYK